jgi:hypothetical protein
MQTQKAKIYRKSVFPGFVAMVAKRCDCSIIYARRVIYNDLGKYEGRNTELAEKIRRVAAQLSEAVK